MLYTESKFNLVLVCHIFDGYENFSVVSVAIAGSYNAPVRKHRILYLSGTSGFLTCNPGSLIILVDFVLSISAACLKVDNDSGII